MRSDLAKCSLAVANAWASVCTHRTQRIDSNHRQTRKRKSILTILKLQASQKPEESSNSTCSERGTSASAPRIETLPAMTLASVSRMMLQYETFQNTNASDPKAWVTVSTLRNKRTFEWVAQLCRDYKWGQHGRTSTSSIPFPFRTHIDTQYHSKKSFTGLKAAEDIPAIYDLIKAEKDEI